MSSLSASSASAEAGAKPLRSDGQQARQRLLDEALRLFSEHGFAQTSTRTIAQAAGVNISAISYYFGDKQGLYHSAFIEPFSEQDLPALQQVLRAPDVGLRQALHAFYTELMAPLGQGERMRHCLRLHMREMLEPTGLWQQEIEQQIRPAYHGMWALLCRHLGLAQPDEGVQRLSLALVGMPVYLLVAQDVVQAVCPQLLQPPQALQRAVDTLVRYAVTLVGAEAAARGVALPADSGEHA